MSGKEKKDENIGEINKEASGENEDIKETMAAEEKQRLKDEKEEETTRKEVKKEAKEVLAKVSSEAESITRSKQQKLPDDFGNTSDKIQKMRDGVEAINIKLQPRSSASSEMVENWSPAEAVRKVQGGTLCKGMYLTDNLLDEMDDKEAVVKIKDTLEYKGTVSPQEIFQEEFHSQSMTDVYMHNTDKATFFKAGLSSKVSHWGHLDVGFNDSKELNQEVRRKEEGTFVSVVTCEKIPVKAVDLTLEDMELEPAVIEELQNIEKSLKAFSYKSVGHFHEFFERFGSHVNFGLVEFGGTLLSTAVCRDYELAEQSKYYNIAFQAGQLLLGMGYSVSGQKLGLGSFDASKLQDESLGKYNAKDLQNITVTLRKIGGAPGVQDRDEWKNGLIANSSFWRIISRPTPPKPIWELLGKYKSKFENHNMLRTAMEQDWKASQDETKYRKLLILRDWLENIQWEKESIIYSLKILQNMREDFYQNLEKDWRLEVLYCHQVQKYLVWVAQCTLQMKDSLKQLQIKRHLQKITDPYEELEITSFPKIQEIVDCFLDNSQDSKVPVKPFELSSITDLPEVLNECLVDIEGLDGEATNFKLRRIQQKLQLYIKALSGKVHRSYAYIVSILTMLKFSFSIDTMQFAHLLQMAEIDSLSHNLKVNLSMLSEKPNEVMQQACTINLALSCKEQEDRILQYVEGEFPGEICKEIKEIFDEAKHIGENLDEAFLQREIMKLLSGFETDLKPLVTSIRDQLSFTTTIKESRSNKDPPSCKPQESVAKLLYDLNLMRYYPQKLTYEEFTTITADILKDKFNDIPQKLTDLPWYFIRHITALDCTTRENCHIENENSNEYEDSSYLDDIPEIHPLDLIYAIFLCADDFLRQELSDKMTTCQYAVPFILPQPTEDERSENIILDWGLKSISRTFSSHDKIQTKPLVDMEAPVVTWMRLGEDTTLKSRIMNTLLGTKSEHFWHQDLEGGGCEQTVSDGMVEVAWYLPGGRKGDTFKAPITFANVRGDSLHCPAVSEELFALSSVVCLFVKNITRDVIDFLSRMKTFLGKARLIVQSKRRTKDLEQFNLTQHQVMYGTEFASLSKRLRQTIQNEVKNCEPSSLSNIAVALQQNNIFEVDDLCCQQGHLASQKILKDIDDFNKEARNGAKEKILPHQSDLETRRQIAALDKELCRQQYRRDKPVQDYLSDVKLRKWKLQWEMLKRNPISATVRYFLQCLLEFNALDRKYFLQALKLGLNQRSADTLQPLHDEFIHIQQKYKGSDRKEKLREIGEELINRSLGIEHFMRELAIIYEHILSLKNYSNCTDLDDALNLLSGLMAELFMEGTAVEIMDGDSGDVSVAWLSAVLQKVENSSTTSLFKVSVIGAQSSGKSTLLNTAFGLDFPVSSGRCTRGAYMKLLKVDDELRKEHKCDHVLVIDTEGLMSKLSKVTTNYDNELASFIIGISDLILVNNKGEGNEMQDVLLLAISVFLRMNIVGEHQSCHFVHQNISAVGVKERLSHEIEEFVNDLDEKTHAAASVADVEDRYKVFSDVLHYDVTTDNTFVPNLWNGTPPMATPNRDYCSTMQYLKRTITKGICQMNARKQKSFCSVTDFCKRIDELWMAIKHENFVLSFRNVLAVEAYAALKKVWDEEQWKFKRTVRGISSEEETDITNMIREPQANIGKLLESSRLKLTSYIRDESKHIRQYILHYFECVTGCDKCIKDVKNRHFLIHHQEEFQSEIDALERKMTEEVELSLNNLETKHMALQHIRDVSSEIDGYLKQKVFSVVGDKKQQPLTEADKESLFNETWDDTTADILQRVRKRYPLEEVSVENLVEKSITTVLGYDKDKFYEACSKKSLQKDTAERNQFIVQAERHMKLRRFKWLKDEDFDRLQRQANNIIDSIRETLHKSPDGMKFEQKVSDELFKKLDDLIKQIRDDRFKTTDNFKVDMIVYVQDLAVKKYREMHKIYIRESSPETLLQKKKNGYREIFMIMMGQGDEAVRFCRSILEKMILKNIEIRMSPTELLNDLRSHRGEIFRDIKSVQGSKIVDLLKTDQFEEYIDYTGNYESNLKLKLEDESLKHFRKMGCYKEIAYGKLKDIIDTILNAADKTANSPIDGKKFISSFFSKVKDLQRCYDEDSVFLDLLDILDKKEFASIIHKQLEGPIQHQVKQKIEEWDIELKLNQIDFTNFLFKEIVGCDAVCPFCKAPCDVHSGGKSQGKHSVTMHRPIGLCAYGRSGWVPFYSKRTLCVDTCSELVSSYFATFGNKDTYLTLFRNYYKIYPCWKIDGKSDPDVEKYWKWVFARYNAKFAEYYEANEASIPAAWMRYKTNEIIKEIEDNYNITVNMNS